MDSSMERVVKTLAAIAETRFVWPEGLLNPGGPHRRLKGHQYPISMGEDECRAFGTLVEALRPKTCFIIGNAFGLSSAYIADVMKNHGGEKVITLDNQSEGNGQECARVAQALVDQMGLGDFVSNVKGSSPQDIPRAAGDTTHDLIFIDGLHRHPQVTHDFHGVLPLAHDKSVIVFHDSWIRGVPEAVDEAKSKGYRCLWIPTSCEIILAVRDQELFATLQKLFPTAVEDRGRRSYAYGYLLYLREVFGYRLGQLLGAG